jgi:integrase
LTRPQRNPRRSYGTGSLFTHRGKWYGQWLVGGRLIKRAIGPKREPGSRHGLTKRQAEAELRRRMQEVRSAPPGEHLTLEEVGERYIRHVEVVLERKPTTVSDYRSMLRCHLAPHFGLRGREQAALHAAEGHRRAPPGERHVGVPARP